MAQLIERMGSQTTVDGKPIDLGTLVHVGVEFINISIYSETERKKAESLAIHIAQKYGCQYTMLGERRAVLIGDGASNVYLFIASFYNDRK